MAKGLQSWSVKESGAPVSKAEIKTATSATSVSFSSTTRAINYSTTGSSVHPGTTSANNLTELPGQPIATATTAELRTATTAEVTTTKKAPAVVTTENMETGPVWISEEEVSTLTPGKPTTKYPSKPHHIVE